MPASRRGGHERRTDPVQRANEIFEILMNERRRYMLHYLNQAQSRVEIHRITDFLIETASDLDLEDRESVTIELTHNHLPRLSEYDIIEYNARSETIRYQDDPLLETFLEQVRNQDLS